MISPLLLPRDYCLSNDIVLAEHPSLIQSERIAHRYMLCNVLDILLFFQPIVP